MVEYFTVSGIRHFFTILVQEAIFNLEIYHNNDQIRQSEYFIPSTSVSQLGVTISRGTSVSYEWTLPNSLLDQSYDLTQTVIEQIQLNSPGVYEIEVEAQNLVSYEKSNVSLVVQNSLDIFPGLQFLNRITYFNTDTNAYTLECTNPSNCIPVFNASDLALLLFISPD